MAAIDLASLTPQQLDELKSLLGLSGADADGRSPMRPRQLHDLRLLPTADDPRPTFFMSAESPRDGSANRGGFRAYPKLLWQEDTGQERTVKNHTEEQRLGEGWTDTPPVSRALSEMDQIAAQLAALSPEDRTFLIDAQRKDRMGKLQSQIANLSEADLGRLTGAEPAAPKRRGRPPKVA